ncbi:iron-sulfur cluster repair protein YtfE [Chitiniphilus purpureus]|uniref:Iron-sulfur cluster repair protein YtfE n=1 Tax=Chitiniphilus purpureus TaxID=2981137 RepID=A0ABY6DH37_9NEIS|nr:iron-sulfur cluster repair protein YtfE [Chitiniphilus sp. CD1]UXY13657.1 iron-sulfur cluster repair protein YtfE [Chitiniphilus sp. CD1]
MNLLDQPIGQIACDIPGATALFHQHKLDFCCGGGKPLREAAAKKQVDAAALAQALLALAASQTRTAVDWRTASNDALIDHILTRYHARHREQLPELVRLARRVEAVHAERADCPHGLADLLAAMEQEMESHMQKEEQVLFPMLRQTSPQAVPGPISVMRFEHDQHGETLARLAALTHDFTPPAEACNTWRALYAGAAQLCEDLMQHIHLENNVLFLQRAPA